MERVVRERMTIQEIEKATPNVLINIRPVVAAMKEFFGGSQLSQFMDQTNPLAELTTSGGCPRSGPAACRESGPGSMSATSTTATTVASARSRPRRTEHRPDRLARDLRPDQQYGFIETPYRKVKRTWPTTRPASTSTRPDRTSRAERAPSSSRPASRSPRRHLGAQEAEGARLPDPPGRHRRDRLHAG